MRKTVLTLIFLGSLFANFESMKLYLDQLKRNNVLLTAFEDSRKTVEYYKTVSGKEAARGKVQQLQISELRQVYPEIVSELKDLKIKIGRLESFSTTTIKSEKTFKTYLKDSTIFDTVKIKLSRYHDNYYNVSNRIIGDSLFQSISSIDTIDQVFYKGARKKPLMWIFSKRQIEQSVRSRNPNNKITFNRTIQITK